jgi:hypothetical protein
MTNTELMTYRRKLQALQSRLNTEVSDLVPIYLDDFRMA